MFLFLNTSYENNSITAIYHRTETETDKIKITHDKYGRIKSMRCNGSPLIETKYQDEVGGFEESPSCANVKKITDHATGLTYEYKYDEYNGRLTEYGVENSETVMKVFCTGSNRIKYEFDETKLNYEDELTYDEDCLISPRITKAYNNDDWGMNWNFGYDKLGRYVKREENFNIAFPSSPAMTITYKNGTCLKELITYGNKDSVKQEYDDRGNVTEIKELFNSNGFKGRNTNTYEYDAVNRLIKETSSSIANFTRTYKYDKAGNITEVAEDDERETYEYDNNGRLTSIQINGKLNLSITYDLFGNPVNYKGNEMTWERGTFLKSYKNVTYTYDGQGRLYKQSGERNRIRDRKSVV